MYLGSTSYPSILQMVRVSTITQCLFCPILNSSLLPACAFQMLTCYFSPKNLRVVKTDNKSRFLGNRVPCLPVRPDKGHQVRGTGRYCIWSLPGIINSQTLADTSKHLSLPLRRETCHILEDTLIVSSIDNSLTKYLLPNHQFSYTIYH